MTSGVITTLGLMVGLHAGTHSKLAVIGGLLTIAVADAFSNAVGMSVSEEYRKKNSVREVWEAAFATFLTKFIFALTFVVPVIFLELSLAVIISVLWGLILGGIFSFIIAKEEKKKPWLVITEHVVVALLGIVITHYIGAFISSIFV